MAEPARVVLFAPRDVSAAEAAAALDDALQGGTVDAVIVTLPEGDDRSKINFAKTVGAIVQARGAAVLLCDAFDLVARAGADGVHLSHPATLHEALAMLRPLERSVGVAGLRARHDSMEAAELGADYVMFGEPRPDGSVPSVSQVLERAAWWAELFNTPCVAHADHLADVTTLAATGAEFISLGSAVFSAAEGPREAVAKVIEQLSHAS
jgi:thiamine-phosphate pyrophosphorylase